MKVAYMGTTAVFSDYLQSLLYPLYFDEVSTRQFSVNLSLRSFWKVWNPFENYISIVKSLVCIREPLQVCTVPWIPCVNLSHHSNFHLLLVERVDTLWVWLVFFWYGVSLTDLADCARCCLREEGNLREETPSAASNWTGKERKSRRGRSHLLRDYLWCYCAKSRLTSQLSRSKLRVVVGYCHRSKTSAFY